MNLAFETIKRTEYSSTTLEQCIAGDLGMPFNFKAKLAENTVRANWSSLVRICFTNEGHEVGGIDANVGESDYCIVYASKVSKQVISSTGSVSVNTDEEYWNEINEALIRHFFKK